MSTLSGSLRWKEGQRRRAVFAGVMLVALVSSAPFFFFAREQLNRRAAEGLLATRGLQEALAREDEALGARRLAERAEALRMAAAQRGIVPAYWAERRLNVRVANLPRSRVNELLFSIARTEQRFFDVEAFEVAVTSDEDGLFSLPTRVNSPLSVTVQGTLIFQAKDSSR